MNFILNVIRRFWWQISVLVLVAITIFSLLLLDELPKVRGADKLHHFLAYCALMLPVALRRPRYWLMLGIFFGFYSGGIELLQPYVSRYAEWQDWFANVSGLIVGSAPCWRVSVDNR